MLGKQTFAQESYATKDPSLKGHGTFLSVLTYGAIKMSFDRDKSFSVTEFATLFKLVLL